jgi:hypothetical protein
MPCVTTCALIGAWQGAEKMAHLDPICFKTRSLVLNDISDRLDDGGESLVHAVINCLSKGTVLTPSHIEA